MNERNGEESGGNLELKARDFKGAKIPTETDTRGESKTTTTTAA